MMLPQAIAAIARIAMIVLARNTPLLLIKLPNNSSNGPLPGLLHRGRTF